MKSFSVLHVVPALFGNEGVYGGAERYALELAKAMSETVPTTLVAFGAKPRSFKDGLLKVKVVQNLIPFRRFVFDPIGPGLLPYLGKNQVIHYHQTHTFMASVSLVVGKLSGRRVFTSHLGGGGMGLHRVMELAEYYDGHLHISNYSKKVFGHEKLINAVSISGGVDYHRFCPSPVTPSRDFVLFAGRLLPHKGIDYLIEAMPDDTALVIAGRRWRHANVFYERLRQLAKGKIIRFAEDCTDEELLKFYQNALCVVLPSVYQSSDGANHAIPELLGQTLLEGMSCGSPVICTDVASMPEVVGENDDCGFVVPPNDPKALHGKIELLVKNRELVETMGRAARARILSQFTWEAVVNRCLDAYRGRSSLTRNRIPD